MDQKQGFAVIPTFKMPDGFELRDDEDTVYLYRYNNLVKMFSPKVTIKQLETAIREEMTSHERVS